MVKKCTAYLPTGNLYKTAPAIPGLENFVPAIAYHFCLKLPAAFSQPGNGLIEIPCARSGDCRHLTDPAAVAAAGLAAVDCTPQCRNMLLGQAGRCKHFAHCTSTLTFASCIVRKGCTELDRFDVRPGRCFMQPFQTT